LFKAQQPVYQPMYAIRMLVQTNIERLMIDEYTK